MRPVLTAMLLMLTAGAALAQQPASGGCADSGTAVAATPPAPGAEATNPGNAGNTGWSGGTGGSHIGTNPAGAVPESRSWQPPTARGLDLAGAPEPAPC